MGNFQSTPTPFPQWNGVITHNFDLSHLFIFPYFKDLAMLAKVEELKVHFQCYHKMRTCM